jgi:6-pyruvoyltetrahydropterin/6-carboxytetrahydropterin synthase
MGQFIVEKEVQFDAGHRVPNHASKCANPHGHRYRVLVGVRGDLIDPTSSNPEAGMVIDFGEIKKILEVYVHDVYDHGFIVQDTDVTLGTFLSGEGYKVIVVDFPPTAEELAQRIYNQLVWVLSGLAYVKVWETPTSCAIYPGGA